MVAKNYSPSTCEFKASLGWLLRDVSQARATEPRPHTQQCYLSKSTSHPFGK